MKTIHSVSRVMGYVSMGLVVPMMLLTVADVFLRFAFRAPITGTAELTSIMMACLLLGVAWCAVQGRHIKVELVTSRLLPRVRAIVDSIVLLVSLGVAATMTWQTVVTSMYMLRFEAAASILMPVPLFPFYWVVALSFAMLCIAIVTLLIQRIAEVAER